MELTPRELQVITQGATNAHSAQRSFLPMQDCVQEAILWALEHPKKIEMWREKGKYGENLLRFSAKQAVLSRIGKERRRVYQLEKNEVSYYTPAMVRELLPDIFDYDDWTSSGQSEMTDKIANTSRPSEGNTRLAVMSDISYAFYSLSSEDQALLKELHADGGITQQVLAATLGVAEKTVARREQRALQRMVDKLGGELPWWNSKGMRSA